MKGNMIRYNKSGVLLPHLQCIHMFNKLYFKAVAQFHWPVQLDI